MKGREVPVLVGLFLVLALAGPAAAAPKAEGGPAHLSEQGWSCIYRTPLPVVGVYCMPPTWEASDTVVTARIFDTQDAGAESAPFLGTAHVIPAEVYAGQKCLGKAPYFPLNKDADPEPEGYLCYHF